MLLEGTPVGMDLDEVKLAIGKVIGVLNVHDLHVWTVSSGLITATCHIVVAEQSVSSSEKIVQAVAHTLEHDFKITHTTIQIEIKDCGGHAHTTQSNDEHEHKHAH